MNLNIPGGKSELELTYITKLFDKLPSNPTIVEIGACAGRLTWTLSKNSPSGTTIYAIDTWESDRVFSGIGYLLDENQPNTLEYFESFMKERIIDNVIPIKADSLNIEWNEPIDLCIIDPDKGLNRSNLADHLFKWHPHVFGIIAGFNYYEKRIDVRTDVNQLANSLNTHLNIFPNCGIWWIKK